MIMSPEEAVLANVIFFGMWIGLAWLWDLAARLFARARERRFRLRERLLRLPGKAKKLATPLAKLGSWSLLLEVLKICKNI